MGFATVDPKRLPLLLPCTQHGGQPFSGVNPECVRHLSAMAESEEGQELLESVKLHVVDPSARNINQEGSRKDVLRGNSASAIVTPRANDLQNFTVSMDRDEPFLPTRQKSEMKTTEEEGGLQRRHTISNLSRTLSAKAIGGRASVPEQGTTDESSPVQLLAIAAVASVTKSVINLEEPRLSKGLTQNEAADRLAKNGLNVLSPPKELPEIVKYLRNYADPFMLLLLIAGTLSCIAYALDKTQAINWWIGTVLFCVVVFSSTFSYIQEGKSSAVMKSFKSMLPRYAHVIRDGKLMDVESKTLVVGDIVRIATGDQVPADLRLIFCQDLKTETSSLTGEALPVAMTVFSQENEIEKSRNVAFNTSQCMEGEGIGVVFAIGDDTVIGRIAHLVKSTKEVDTTLQKEIKRFVRNLAIFALCLGIIFFIIGISRDPKHWIQSFINGFIVVMIACVPEGLPMTVVSALTITARKMAEKKVFVKRLQSVETLGSATAIATDKTGTLTQNKMSVSRLWYDTHLRKVTDDLVVPVLGVAPKADVQTLVNLALIAGCCNRSRFADQANLNEEDAERLGVGEILRSIQTGDSALTIGAVQKVFPIDPTLTIRSAMARYFVQQDDSGRTVLGDASDTALFNFVRRSTNIELLRHHYPSVLEIPFNSREKYSLAIVRPNNPPGSLLGKEAGHAKRSARKLLLKGAPEVVLTKCTHYMLRGQVVPIDDQFKEEFNDAYELCGGDGERVLGFASLELDPEQFPPSMDAEYSTERKNFPTSGLVFIGLISLIDPPKEGVAEAVKTAREAGIRVLMVTGDHPLTAAAIARKVNILTPGATREEMEEELSRSGPVGPAGPYPSKSHISEDDISAAVVTGADLLQFTEDDWKRVLSKKEIVFARTTPQQKLAIVQHLQKMDEIVAVTGDGVNDAPALKAADIGVAMGISGSDVARDAAAVVLTDDNFASIVVGIREGRRIFDNLTKTIAYTVTHMIPEVVPILLTLAIGMPAALTSLLILLIDLGTEIAPAVSFAYEPAEADVMKRKPRSAKTDRLVTGRVMIYVFAMGAAYTGVGLLGYFLVFHWYGIPASALPFTSQTYFKSGAPDFHTNGRSFNMYEQQVIVGQAEFAYWMLLVMGQVFHVWMCKTRTISVFKHGLLQNSMMFYGVVIEIFILAVVLFVPQVRVVLAGVTWTSHPFDNRIWILLIFIWGLIFLFNEPRKWLIRRGHQSLRW